MSSPLPSPRRLFASPTAPAAQKQREALELRLQQQKQKQQEQEQQQQQREQQEEQQKQPEQPQPSSQEPKQPAGLDKSVAAFPTVKPGLLNQLRRKIEAGDYEAVEELIWSNPRFLVSVCDSAVYLMAGPKYNACHIAARADKPDIMALLLDTISNLSFLRKLYPTEPDSNLQDRVNHLLDSYLNTPDPKLGNTPLHFACKLGHHRVVRVLLTFEGCDLNLRDSNGQTAKESICSQYKPPPPSRESLMEFLSLLTKDLDLNDTEGGDNDETRNTSQNMSGPLQQIESQSDSEVERLKGRIRGMFKQQFHLPHYRDQLKKRLILERRRSRASSQMDSNTSFSDIDESFILNSPAKQQASWK